MDYVNRAHACICVLPGFNAGSWVQCNTKLLYFEWLLKNNHLYIYINYFQTLHYLLKPLKS